MNEPKIEVSVAIGDDPWTDETASYVTITVNLDFDSLVKVDEDAVRKLINQQVRQIETKIKNKWRECWQDDDSPLAETATGTRGRASNWALAA